MENFLSLLEDYSVEFNAEFFTYMSLIIGIIVVSFWYVYRCYWSTNGQLAFCGYQNSFLTLPEELKQFRPGAAAVACSSVEISVSCRNLSNMDVFSKSDPMCVLFVKECDGDVWTEFGRTEVIWNNLNPEWAKMFRINYYFEERQLLKFEIYDVDSNSPDLQRHDFLGQAECTLGEAVSRGKYEAPLRGGPGTNRGSISIIASEENQSSKEELTFRFEGEDLVGRNWFGWISPALTFYRANDDGAFSVVHRTERVRNNSNPKWKQFSVPARTFCCGDDDKTILVRCFHMNAWSQGGLIGEFFTTVREMKSKTQKQADPAVFDLIRNKKIAGRIVLKSLVVQELFSFVDYIQSGTQLNCTIAIDFTASNGDPAKSNSYHYIHPNIPNHYQRAIRAVGEIVEDYDSDKLFPVLGFGARLPPDGRVSHEFFVNGSTNDPFCHGISGVMDAYRNCLVNVQLYGPTNFAPCINHVAKFAEAVRDGSEYFILLIITDGVICDMAKTKEAVVAASALPLSIIIVGVGDDDFAEMRELDGDDVRLSYNGRYAERDIVQFVAFRDFVKNGKFDDVKVSQRRLAKEVLAEIPSQFLSYMKKHEITPGCWRKGARVHQQPYFAHSAAGRWYKPRITSPKASAPPDIWS